MEIIGLQVALGESVGSEWTWGSGTSLHTTVDFINPVHWGYTQFIKHDFNQAQEKMMTSRDDTVNTRYMRVPLI